MSYLRLVSVGGDIKKEGYQQKTHSHNVYELVCYQYGKGIMTVGEDTYSFADNSFVLIPPHVNHGEIYTSESKQMGILFSSELEFPQTYNSDESGAIYKILKELYKEIINQKYGYKEMIDAKMTELYINILRSKNKTSSEKNFEYIINCLNENFYDHIVLSNYAKQLNISYDYFQHKFKKITGYSPQQYLLNRRLHESENLLKAGDLSCTQIAYRCGFSTSAQFSALFKKNYGITPLQFRKKYK